MTTMRGWSLALRRLAKKRGEPDCPEKGETRSPLTGTSLRPNRKKGFFIMDLMVEQFPCPDKFPGLEGRLFSMTKPFKSVSICGF